MFITILLIISSVVNTIIYKEKTEPIISPTYGPNTKQEEIINQTSNQAMPWDVLKSFTQAEKENTQITISLPGDANEKTRMLSKEIEQEWKNHNYDKVFSLFENLKPLINPAFIEIGIHFLNPPTNSDLWGSDKRVGSYDSLNTVCFDFEADSSKIFALVASRTRNTRIYQLCRSTNGGTSWSSLSTWTGVAVDGYRDVDLVVTKGYAFVAYIYTNQIRVRRHSSITGIADSVRTVFTGTATDSCYDVAITSDVDEYPSEWWLYVTARVGSTVYAKRSTNGLTWNNYATIGTNAIGRVDIAYAPYSTTTELFVTYHRNNDSLYVVRNTDYGDSLDWLTPQNTGATRKNSSANAWPSVAVMADTAIIVYEYNYGPGDNDVNFVISTNEGATWTQGSVFLTTTNEGYPNITGRSGAGWAVVCVYDVGSTCNVRFRQSTRYSSPSFTNTFNLADSIARYNVCPAIEYYDLPSPRYGVVYVSFRPYEWAWFDYNSVGITEELTNNKITSKSIAINCFPNPSVSPKIELEIPKASTVNLKIYDINGNLVRDLINKKLSAGKTTVIWDGRDNAGIKVTQGIYFVKLTTETKSVITKVIKLQ